MSDITSENWRFMLRCIIIGSLLYFPRGNELIHDDVSQIMKKSIILFAFALSTGVACAAHAENNSAACTQLSSDIAARSALFLSAVRAAPEWTEITRSTPVAVREGAHDKQVVLNNIANEIWSLRTRMAYLDCTQAKTFAY